MRNELNKIAFGLVTVLAAMTFAQVEPAVERTAVPMTDDELTELVRDLSTTLSSNTVHNCVNEMLKGKQASQIMKVKEDWREFVAVEGTVQEWKKLVQTCNLKESYYDILVNANGQTGNTKISMRSVQYVYSEKLNSKIYFYSPAMTQQEFNSFTATLRSVSPTSAIDMGEMQATKSFQRVTVKNKIGKEMVLTSIEQRLAERIQECQQSAKPNEESTCESLGYGIQMQWVYNNYISYMVFESMEDSKVDASVERVVSVGDSKIESIKDIRDIFSEESLLASLKQDWIIRNSNQWTLFAKAQSWDQFWNLKAKDDYDSVAKFQSYSNKLDKAQINKVKTCAKIAGENLDSNSGFACVNSKKAPSLYMFNYSVMAAALKNSFSITKMNAEAVYVRIPLMSDSTGGSNLSLALPRNSSDFYKSLQ